MMSNMYGVAAVVFALVACGSPALIRLLRALKLTQPIRGVLPAGHQAKRGTPLMAGLVLLTGAGALLAAQPGHRAALLAAAFMLFSLIGFADDFKKAVHQNPDGVSARTKLLLQLTATALVMYGVFLWESHPWQFAVPLFGGAVLLLHPVVYIIVIALFIVGTANAVNFTDGLDGLLIMAAVPTYFFFFASSDSAEVRIFSLAMIAALLGLLFYNAYPARAFMGDTGSLAIGGSLAFLVWLEHVEVLSPLLFIVYFAEQLSVMLQVAVYRRTKRRLFRMAPVHYHFSLKYGWSENKIVLAFGIVSWAGVLAALALRHYAM